MTIPLIILAFISFAGGFIELPNNIGHVTVISDFIQKTLPITAIKNLSTGTEWLFQLIAAGAAISGIFFAYLYYYDKPFPVSEPKRNTLEFFFFKGWDFDLLYDNLIVNPIVFLSRIDKKDFIDLVYNGIASIMTALHKFFSASQNGKLRTYACCIAIGTIVTLTIILFS
jgi:NADH-quinone oxidoreductase subunit L